MGQFEFYIEEIGQDDGFYRMSDLIGRTIKAMDVHASNDSIDGKPCLAGSIIPVGCHALYFYCVKVGVRARQEGTQDD